MRTWLLDDGPFGTLARFFDPSSAFVSGTLHVAEAVAAGAVTDQSGRRTKLLALAGAQGPVLTVHSLIAGTAEFDMLYTHLRPDEPKSARDLGEDESIALAAHKLTTATFATADKGAAYQALVELGPGRVASPFDLWWDLRSEGVVTAATFDALCHATWKSDRSGIAGLPKRYFP